MAQSIGDYCYKVQLQQRTVAKDAVGGPIENWTTTATVYAGVSDLTAREIFLAQKPGYHLTRVVRIRYRTDIDETWRVICHDGKIGRIGAKIMVGRHEAFDLLVEIAA